MAGRFRGFLTWLNQVAVAAEYDPIDDLFVRVRRIERSMANQQALSPDAARQPKDNAQIAPLPTAFSTCRRIFTNASVEVGEPRCQYSLLFCVLVP